MLETDYLLLKNSFIMTINEKKQLSEYIKGLVKESINEMPLPDGHFGYGSDYLPDPDETDLVDTEDEEEADIPSPEDLKPFGGEMDNPRSHYGGPDVTSTDDDDFGSPAGLDELRNLCEGIARDAVSNILMEKKGGSGWKNKGAKGKKRKNKKEKTSSRDKTVVSQLNADGTNAAHYFYKLYGVENGTDAQKAAARSKGYKKAKGKKNDTGVPYKFTSKERNRLSSLLTDRI